jgi:hypothetical protein
MPATIARAVMKHYSRIAEHATAFEGVVATFTKIDKADGSTKTGAAGTKAREQETPQCVGNIDIRCLNNWTPFYYSPNRFVSTGFGIKCNSAIGNMTAQVPRNLGAASIMFQIHTSVHRTSHV